MVTINRNGVTLSAHAGQNGATLPARPFVTPGAGDYAERAEGRARRKARRDRISAKRTFLAGM